MTTPATPTADRYERAARTLAYFEGSDAFNDDLDDTAERRAAQSQYRARAAALLARSGTVTPDRRPTRTSADYTDAALGLSFSRQVSAAQLAAMSPDEITTLFGALHTIASIAGVQS